MSVTVAPPPTFAPPPKKKSGLGCLGCGCAILVVIVLLIAALIGSTGYAVYRMAVGLTTTTPGDVPVYTGDPAVLAGAQKKIAQFRSDALYHKPSTLQLSGDEINSLIANDPDAAKNKVHAFVTLTGGDARLQASLPTDKISHGLLTGRFVTLDTTFTVTFDADTKSVVLMPSLLQIGDKPMLTATTDAKTMTSVRSMMVNFNMSFNQALRGNAAAADLLDHAKDIEVKDGQLDIDTE